MSQREVWDILAMDWAKFRHSPQEQVQEFLSDKKGLILDLGCGAGRNLIEGKKFVAVDSSKNMLYIAQKKLVYRDEIDFSLADACRLPFKSRSFDCAIFISTLHTVYRKSHDDALREMHRVVKPGSHVLISVWNKNQPRFLMGKNEAFVDWKIGEKVLQRYYYLFTKKELRKLLERHGFEVISVKGSRKKAYRLFSRDIIAVAKKK
jgi:ubiquinone/menaquinone biosynthesis C-methylase UbiE